MKIENADFGEYTGSTAGQAQEERWVYEGIGYNATDGIFYIGKQEAKTLEFVPFALRQCKEVEKTLFRPRPDRVRKQDRRSPAVSK